MSNEKLIFVIMGESAKEKMVKPLKPLITSYSVELLKPFYKAPPAKQLSSHPSLFYSISNILVAF